MQPEDHNNKYNHNRQQEVHQQHNMMSYQAMKMTRIKRVKEMKMTKMKRVKAMKMTKMKRFRAKKKTLTRRKRQEHDNPD
jgi:hypothetical protein